jgi:hydroxymethylglutaryl-CoA synthase
MINVGIDAIDFYVPHYYLDLKDLAVARGIDPEKFCVDLGQQSMAIVPPGEDVVTLAANAAAKVLRQSKISVNDIAMLLFATESSFDCSKAAGMYLHRLLHLPQECRVVELKQACYGATAGLQLALPFLRQNPNKKVLLVASDIARYDLNSAAESSQGAGAVAMVLAASPRLLAIEQESGVCAKEVMDFWRPNYCDVALVDGWLSCDAYLKMLLEAWSSYVELSQRTFDDHQRFCYHTPVPKLVERAHRRLAKKNGYTVLNDAEFELQVGESFVYNRVIGNTYTASLYLGIISLLDNAAEDLQGKRIGLYSYGSGSVAEYFSAVVMLGYRACLQPSVGASGSVHQRQLELRQRLSYAEYEQFYNFKLPHDGSSFVVPQQYEVGEFKLAKIEKHQRIYAACERSHASY